MKQTRYKILVILMIFAVFYLPSLYGADRAPINVNLIIDGSSSLTNVKTDITTWVSGRLDQIVTNGDRVTIWSAGSSAKVIYSGAINAPADKEAAKKSVRDLAGSGTSADFSGALREASNLPSSYFNYTLLISASNTALTNLLSGSQSNMMRFSRVEDFSGWRAIVIGLNLDARVKRAAAAFFGS